jgi:hypothetical protein
MKKDPKKSPTKPAKKCERKHSVKAHLSVFELAKAKSALTMEIYASNEKIGTIEIGRGSLYWWGKGRKNSERISWTRFADMMDQLAYGK